MTEYSLRQLTYFVTAARLRSMTAAAEALHVSQSTVSLAISDLERELGVQLFVRRRAKGLSLTPAGQSVQADAQTVLAEAERLREHATERLAGISGSLALSCFAPLAPFVVPRLIGEFHDTHPSVDIGFMEGSLLTVQEHLLDGRAELALTYDHELGPRLRAHPLLVDLPMHVIVSGDHPLASATEVRLGELASEALIIVEVAPSRQHLETLLAQVGLADKIRYRVATYELACALAGRGLGCAILGFEVHSPVSCEGRTIASAKLLARAPSYSVVVAHVEGSRLTRRAQLFFEHAISTYRSPA